MGIFDALNTSVSGLQAQSFALQNISGNIANASTVGFKGTDTSFEDIVPTSVTPDQQPAGGVRASALATITSQGTVSATAVATNMAISGSGFFNVQKPVGVVDNVAVFNGVTDYTRRGDFQLNANGNLVNGAGYYLLGVTVDPKTGNPIGNVPQVLQFQNNFIPAQATTKITYAANLPTRPSTVASSTAAIGSLTALGGLNPADFTSNPQIIGTPPAPFTDATFAGSSVNNKAAVPAPITGATTLSGAAGTDSLTSNFGVGDTITVNGTPITLSPRARSAGPSSTHRQHHDDAGQDRFDQRRGDPLDRQRWRDHAAYRCNLEPDGHEFERGGIWSAWLPSHRDSGSWRRRYRGHRRRHR